MPRYSQVRLTKRLIDAARPPITEDSFLWDSEVRGLAMRLYATGRRVFVLQYRAPATGTTRRLTLGPFPTLTVDQARAIATRTLGELASGNDPRTTLPIETQRATMTEVFACYLLERRAKIARRTAEEYLRVWEKLLVPTFGAKRVSAVDEMMVARWHSERSQTPVAANRAVGILSTFFFWAERRGYRAKHSNPCAEIEHYAETAKGRSLTREEYARLGATLDAALRVGLLAAPKLRKVSANSEALKHRSLKADIANRANPTIVAALRFLVLSGWRENEVLSLRWDEINFESGVAILSQTKTGRSERPLGATSLALLQTQARVQGNPYVFPGEKAGRHLAEPKRLWQAIKYAALLEDSAPLRLHDLRHSFTTVARDELGLGDHVIAKLVGHKISGQTSRYGQVRDATLKNAANLISAQIDAYLNAGGARPTILPFFRQA